MSRPLLFNTIRSSFGNFNKFYDKDANKKINFVIKGKQKLLKQKNKMLIRNKNKIKK